MTARQRIGLFLAIAGFALLVTAGVFWRGDAGRRAEIKTETTALEDSVRKVHDEIVSTNLRFRGFRESQSTMPDSVRRHGGVKIMEITQGFNKVIRKLEMTERDIKLEISALGRESKSERERARSRGVATAGSGLVVLLIGVLLMFLPGRRVGA